MTQPDMNAILQQARQMQARPQAAQQEIVAFAIVGEAGGGLIKVTMQGSGEATDIAIDPEVVDPKDANGLQDLVLVALQDATTKVRLLAEQKMGPLSQGFNDLGDLGL